MENIYVKIKRKTREVNPKQIFIGLDGENLQENVIFSFEDEFVQGQARLEVEFRDGTKGQITDIQKNGENYVLPIKSEITKYSGCKAQLVIDEGTDENAIPIFKSLFVGLIVAESINASTPVPEGYTEWIDSANAKLNEMDTLNLDASKSGKVTAVIITRKDGTQKIVQVLDGIDGIGLNFNWNGTSLGVKREDEENYHYTNLKGDTGAPGQIKMLIVNELPLVGSGDTLYFVPKDDPKQQDIYDEYAWLDNKWERLGEKQIKIDLSDYYTKQETNTLLDGKADVEDIPDLTDYVKNTDYATSQKGGVIKVYQDYGTDITGQGRLCGTTKIYSDYLSGNNAMIISKGTLENVITGKDLTTKAYVDGLVGDINTALDAINGEVI